MINREYDGISLDNFADWVSLGWTGKREPLRDLAVMTLGLVGEAGEVTELIKKEIRGDGPLNHRELTLELGDVLHYLCRIAQEYNISMNEVMVSNMEKIEGRRGKRKWEQGNAVHT
jgi:NTP pyrophosphatase (non-canonical NTP hydrolase)